MLRAQPQVVLQDRLDAFPLREIVKDHKHRDARAPKSRRAVHPLRIDPDLVAPVHGRPGDSGTHLLAPRPSGHPMVRAYPVRALRAPHPTRRGRYTVTADPSATNAESGACAMISANALP